jgi:hypothetical protein
VVRIYVYLFLVWPFDKTEVLDPAPIAPPVDREAESHARVRLLKAQMDSVDGEMLKFKIKHGARTNRFGILLRVESPSMTGYAAIRSEWDALLRRRDKLTAQWHSALREWSESKKAEK